ncbi:ABC transporter permease [Clostridium saccharoperbutylacetonicum]|uniref:ABC transporter permease n=1 Tax=Clostridium saccharoperbutylacetonicum TaxID=36745 RepID=UPI0009840212|nr:FtsX-like permease family protein [Clostridium saccharoperbutylacetonicum]AQR93454.1 FtsX-like permease family protein [Clostridium saccharoperbutylacetonicum]NSB29152.1 putative ABC transport system permease protein [Clostridium saccharoperbutylacetonicum]
MNILLKNLFRDIKKSKGQFISTLIIVILGVTFYTSLNSVFKNLSNSSNKYFEEYRLGDIWVDLYKAPTSTKEELEKLPEVEMATGRIVKDASISISEENATLRFITLPDVKKNIVNDITIKTGRYFSDADNNQCILDEDFFKANDLKLNDYIYPVINGNKVKLKIVGVAKSPEFIYTLKDSGELVPDNKRFGVIYIKQSFGEAVFDLKGSINNISIKLKSGSDIEGAKDETKRLLKNYGVKSLIDRKQQTSTMMINEEIKKLKSMGGSFPVIFFMVASVIIYIMMGRMVENQRTQIGVMKALGFSNIQVLAYYMSYSGIIAIVGSLIGSALGTYMGFGMTKLLNQYFNLPLSGTRVYGEYVIPASLLTLMFCLFAGYRSCKVIFKIMPSEAMREKSPLSGRKIIVEKIDFIWRKISRLERIIVRNLFRYKRRALLTSLGIIFSSAILLVAFSMNDSVNFMIIQQYGNIQNYDIKVNFSKLVSVEELKIIKNMEHVTEFEPILETGIELSNGWRSKEVGFTALTSNPKMYKVQDKDGNALELPKDGLLISQKLAETLGIGLNDSVNIKFFFPGKDEKKIMIKGIVVQYLGSGVYTSMEDLNSILGEGMIANSAVLRLDNSEFEKTVKDKLKDIPGVSSVESKTDSSNAFIKNMGAMKSTIGMLIMLAAILLIAVLYNIATINIFERQRELATLKVLGFNNKEIKKLIFNENYIISIFGMTLGLPFGTWLGRLLIDASSTDAYSIPYVVEFKSYVFTIILTLAFTVTTNLILSRKIKAIDMLEVLKNKE